MSDNEYNEGIHEIHSFEVDEFDIVCGPVCGGKVVSSTGVVPARHQVHFNQIFADAKTRALFMMMLNHVRATSETISFPYRCDTETHCVYLRAVVSKSSTMHVGFVNKVMEYELRPENARLVCSLSSENPDFTLCSICNRLRHENQWLEFQQLVDQEIWPADGKPMGCQFDTCANCENALRQRVAETQRSYTAKAACSALHAVPGA